VQGYQPRDPLYNRPSGWFPQNHLNLHSIYNIILQQIKNELILTRCYADKKGEMTKFLPFRRIAELLPAAAN
jgi:hypothetical protein